MENDAFLDIELNANWPNAFGYDFGERGLRPQLISLQLLLASTLPPTQLVDHLTLGDGDAWAAFTADSHANADTDCGIRANPASSFVSTTCEDINNL